MVRWDAPRMERGPCLMATGTPGSLRLGRANSRLLGARWDPIDAHLLSVDAVVSLLVLD